MCWKLIQLYEYILSTDYIQRRALDVALETNAQVQSSAIKNFRI